MTLESTTSSHASAPRAVGLVSPLPPQVGGVASVSEWLLEHASDLGCSYVTFDLTRPPDEEAGGRFRVRSALRQVSLLGRYLAWLRAAPPLVHYTVALTRTGLLRDTVFVVVTRLSRRRIVAHVHGAGLEGIRPGSPRARALALIGGLSAVSVTISPSLSDALRRLGMQAVSIYNPLRATGASEAGGRRDESDFLRLLFVGTYGERKGCPELLRALALARGSGIDARLTLAGKEEHRGEEASLRALTAALGLESAVSFAGVVDRRGLGELYATASVFCLPSRREGLPMALLEAMAAGMPTITTAVGGMRDVVEDGVTGIVVEPGDEEGVAAAIERLADGGLRKALGVAAAERVLSLAGERAIVEQWRNLYEQAGRRVGASIV